MTLTSCLSVNIIIVLQDEVWSSQLEKILHEIRPVRQSPSVLAPNEDAFVAKEVNVNMLDELEKQNKQLQSMVGHYKSIISDTVSQFLYVVVAEDSKR